MGEASTLGNRRKILKTGREEASRSRGPRNVLSGRRPGAGCERVRVGEMVEREGGWGQGEGGDGTRSERRAGMGVICL